jgi:murein L,D-transpeptidase YcbB/YkuD
VGSPGLARRLILCAAAALASHAVAAGDVLPAEARPGDDVRFYLATREVPPYVRRDSRGAAVWSAVQSFYRSRDYRLAWAIDGHFSPVADAVAGIVSRADGEGIGTVAAASPADAPLAVQDVHLTYSLLRYAADLSGRFDPRSTGPFWLISPTPRDLAPWLEEALATGRVVEAVSSLSPEAPAYGALRGALRRYREIQDQGGWPSLPAHVTMRRGSRGPQVALLRARLAAEGYLASSARAGSDTYDAVMRRAKSFEARTACGPMACRRRDQAPSTFPSRSASARSS